MPRLLQYSLPPGYERKKPVERPKLGSWLRISDQILCDFSYANVRFDTAREGPSEGLAEAKSRISPAPVLEPAFLFAAVVSSGDRFGLKDAAWSRAHLDGNLKGRRRPQLSRTAVAANFDPVLLILSTTV
jgi:hypothetical protein